MIASTLFWIAVGFAARSYLSRRRAWFRDGAVVPSEDIATALRRGRR